MACGIAFRQTAALTGVRLRAGRIDPAMPERLAFRFTAFRTGPGLFACCFRPCVGMGLGLGASNHQKRRENKDQQLFHCTPRVCYLIRLYIYLLRLARRTALRGQV